MLDAKASQRWCAMGRDMAWRGRTSDKECSGTTLLVCNGTLVSAVLVSPSPCVRSACLLSLGKWESPFQLSKVPETTLRPPLLGVQMRFFRTQSACTSTGRAFPSLRRVLSLGKR